MCFSLSRRLSLCVVLLLVPSARSAVDRLGDPLPPGAVARFGSARLQHGRAIAALAFSPNGKTLASSGAGDHTVRLWDTATGCERGRLAGHVSAMECLAFAPDGTHLVSGDYRTFRLWDVTAGRVRHQWSAEKATPLAVAFRPDGKVLVAGYNTNPPLFVLYDVATGNKLRQLSSVPRGGTYYVLAFSADGRRLAVACNDIIRLWDVATGKRLRTYEGSEDFVHTLAFSPDGKVLASSAGGRIRLWETDSEELIRQLPSMDSPIVALRFAPDGATLTSFHMDGVSIRWATATGQPERVTGKKYNEWMCRRVSPDGATWVGWGRHGDIHLMDAASGKERLPVDHLAGPVARLTFGPDGRNVVTVCVEGTTVVWDVAGGRQRRRFGRQEKDMEVFAVTPAGDRVAVADEGSNVHLWDTKTGQEVRPSAAVPKALDLAFAPDGRTFAAAGPDGVVRLYDTATGEERRQLTAGPVDSIHSLVFATDGRSVAGRVAVANDNTLIVWEVATGRERLRLPLPGSPFCLAFSPDSRLLAVGDSSGVLGIYRLADGKMRHRLAAHENSINTLAFSPDGCLLATGGNDNAVRLWDVAAGKELGHFTGHEAAVSALAFAPDGRALASGSYDLTAIGWDVPFLLRKKRSAVVPEPTDARLEQLWTDLASTDAQRAYTALSQLTTQPRRALPFLAARLRPAAPADAQRLRRLLADLDSNQFAVRTRATTELTAVGELAEPALRRTLADKPSLDLRRRIEDLLKKRKQTPPSSDALRQLRAVEALESIGSTEAVKLLETLATGAPEARQTREAHAALQRLARRRSSPQ